MPKDQKNLGLTSSENGDNIPLVSVDKGALKLQWFVVQVRTGCESYVMKALHRAIAELNYIEGHNGEKLSPSDCFGEFVVPTEKVVEILRGRKITSDRKYFPGYILIQMHMTEGTWHFVKSIPNVANFVGRGRSADLPSPVCERDVDDIIGRAQKNDAPKPRVVYQAGEVVRIIEGPFIDFNGVVEEVNYEKNHLIVAVTVFSRSTPVELDFSQVEKGG